MYLYIYILYADLHEYIYMCAIFLHGSKPSAKKGGISSRVNGKTSSEENSRFIFETRGRCRYRR